MTFLHQQRQKTYTFRSTVGEGSGRFVIDTDFSRYAPDAESLTNIRIEVVEESNESVRTACEQNGCTVTEGDLYSSISVEAARLGQLPDSVAESQIFQLNGTYATDLDPDDLMEILMGKYRLETVQTGDDELINVCT